MGSSLIAVHLGGNRLPFDIRELIVGCWAEHIGVGACLSKWISRNQTEGDLTNLTHIVQQRKRSR